MAGRALAVPQRGRCLGTIQCNVCESFGRVHAGMGVEGTWADSGRGVGCRGATPGTRAGRTAALQGRCDAGTSSSQPPQPEVSCPPPPLSPLGPLVAICQPQPGKGQTTPRPCLICVSSVSRLQATRCKDKTRQHPSAICGGDSQRNAHRRQSICAICLGPSRPTVRLSIARR